jgi:uncharacterized protein (TIGR02452 family)
MIPVRLAGEETSMNAKAIAMGTVAALEEGRYRGPDGSLVDISMLLSTCINGTEPYDPDQLVHIREQILARPKEVGAATTALEVVNETTLQGCARLVAERRYKRIGVLNFASARHPGGGFLGGARAQEESLARSSGLYFSLNQCPDHYAFHRAQQTCLYSDRMIYSPACPVVRDDAGNWLPEPYVVDFITSPAPNAGAVRQNEPANSEYIEPVLRERAGKILTLCAYKHCDALVLGAWGCGVFKNDPGTVAKIFFGHLSPAGIYAGYFRRIVFSVYDSSSAQETYRAFAEQLADRPPTSEIT